MLFVPADTGIAPRFDDDCGAIVLLVDPHLRREVDAALAPFGCRVPETAYLMQDAAHLRALLPIIHRLAAMREPGARKRMERAGVAFTATNTIIAELAQDWSTPHGSELIQLLFAEVLPVVTSAA